MLIAWRDMEAGGNAMISGETVLHHRGIYT